MSRAALLPVLLLLAFLGFVDALYLAGAAMTGNPLVCDIEGLSGCNVVAQSPYARVLGVPLGVYGVVFYVLIILLALAARYVPRPGIDRALAVLAALGVLASAWFLYVQFALIKAVCIYCIASAVIALLLGLAAWRLLAGPSPEASPLPPAP